MSEVERIKKLAKERGVSYSTIAANLGLNANFLNDVAAGKCRLNDIRLEKIAELLNTTVEYLRGETDEKNKPASKNESEPNFEDMDIKLLIHYYTCFSTEGQSELVQKAHDIWQKEHNKK